VRAEWALCGRARTQQLAFLSRPPFYGPAAAAAAAAGCWLLAAGCWPPLLQREAGRARGFGAAAARVDQRGLLIAV